MEADNSSAVIFIIGTTAVGKTKLSIDLATQLQGEVVSADSMQVYKGADIMTAKATATEQSLVRHHMIDVISPLCADWHVGMYQDMALQCISEVHSRGKLPVVVGGTMYYIESLLYDQNFESYENHLEGLDPDARWKILEERDPEYAAVTSKGNARKIESAVRYILSTGNPYSHRGRYVHLRYPKTVVLWLQCKPDVLEGRIRERISSMEARGGLEEVQRLLALSPNPNFTKGVMQSIGYKEFQGHIQGHCTLDEAMEELVQSTLKYSRKQEKWIRTRLVPVVPVQVLDSSDLSTWGNLVNTALDCVANCLQDSGFSLTIERRSQTAFMCERCRKRVVGEAQWKDHLKSKAHRNVYKKKTPVPQSVPSHSFLFDEEPPAL